MNFKIAVCDDEQIICSTMYNKLQNLSKSKSVIFEIDCFTSGEELCDEIKHTNYDLLFLDIELPKMNGVAVGRYIEKHLKMKPYKLHIYLQSKNTLWNCLKCDQ